METMAQKWQVSLEMRAFLITGVLGGFTTFSAFSFDVLKLVDTGQCSYLQCRICDGYLSGCHF